MGDFTKIIKFIRKKLYALETTIYTKISKIFAQSLPFNMENSSLKLNFRQIHLVHLPKPGPISKPALAFFLSLLMQQRVLHQSDSISKIDLRERKKMIWPPGPYSLMSNLWYITASCPAAWAWMNKATRTLSMFLSLFINGYIGSLASSLLIYYLCYIRHCSWEKIFLG